MFKPVVRCASTASGCPTRCAQLLLAPRQQSTSSSSSTIGGVDSSATTMISALRKASTAATVQPHPAAEQFPTIRELRETMLAHAAKVYNGPKVEFDATRAHDRSIGTQHSIIPIASRHSTSWRTYQHNKKLCRFGVVLEELDILATYVGYKHNQDPNVPIGTPAHHSLGVVTGRVDRVDITPGAEFRSDQDLVLTGYVSWIGNSSMEVTVDVHQDDQQLLTSKFVMVSIATDAKSGAPNVPLVLNTDAERRDFEAGERAKNQRAHRDKTSVTKVPPTQEEEALLRYLTLPILDQRSLTDARAKLTDDQVWMRDTKADTVMMSYPEQTNLHGYIFGGYLLREAYDIAWANTAQFSKRLPFCLGITDGIFPAPVPVNSLLHYNSQVCYTDGRFAEVAVEVVIEHLEKGKFTTSNTFHFTFDTHDQLPTLIPQTFSEGLRYLTARRQYLYFKNKE